MNISSIIYRGYEIVSMPNGARLIHRGDRTGPLVGQKDSEGAARIEVDRLVSIVTLNDLCRTAMGVGGRVLQTVGIRALPSHEQSRIREKVELFSDFNADNDPYGEHDFGSFEHGDVRVMFKIDCYNLDLTAGSEDPSDPKQTLRVLTIMLDEEY